MNEGPGSNRKGTLYRRWKGKKDYNLDNPESRGGIIWLRYMVAGKTIEQSLKTKDMDEAIFRKVMAVIVLLTILIVLVMEYRPSKTVPEGSFFVVATGISAGFTTMIGNLAGAFANLYFLGMQVPKNAFIGTSAWIFLCMNLFKLPFQLFYWENINIATLKIDAWLIPAVAIGFIIGIKIVKRVEDGQYRKLVILLTLAGSLMMLLKR